VSVGNGRVIQTDTITNRDDARIHLRNNGASARTGAIYGSRPRRPRTRVTISSRLGVRDRRAAHATDRDYPDVLICFSATLI
jgi:hypothetical protein